MSHDMTGDSPEETPPRTQPTRYWTDGTEVTLDVEEALDRIVETVKRVQAKLQAP